jgi:Winged helix DNA-binding domain
VTTEEDGIDHLVRRYLTGFGPASRADIASWAGLPGQDVARALERLRLRRFRDESGGELVDLPRAPLPDSETPAPVRLLPVWDAMLLVHARRTGILPEQHRPAIFNIRTPHSVPTFLVDGAVAGTWRYEKGRVTLAPFGRLDTATRRELRDEADRLAAFHA